MPKKKRGLKTKCRTFRCTPEVEKQLVRLMDEYGENGSQVIVRLIAQAYIQCTMEA